VESKRDRERREANMSAEETQKGGTETARGQSDKRKEKTKKNKQSTKRERNARTMEGTGAGRGNEEGKCPKHDTLKLARRYTWMRDRLKRGRKQDGQGTGTKTRSGHTSAEDTEDGLIQMNTSSNKK
jgi:hypothetical protein